MDDAQRPEIPDLSTTSTEQVDFGDKWLAGSTFDDLGFHEFCRKMRSLDAELQNFSHVIKQLGSAVGLVSSVVDLREQASAVFVIFRFNAAHLGTSFSTVVKNPLLRKINLPSSSSAASVLFESLPSQLSLMASAVEIFLNYLNGFAEFKDGLDISAARAFEEDLKYWSSSLHVYKGRLHTPELRRYTHEITEEMNQHLDEIMSVMQLFVVHGVPTIKETQRNSAAILLSMTAVSTFFSSVTATTLQFSFEKNETVTESAVNFFWFLSLVFSVCSAVNSLIALTFSQDMYRSPEERMPFWVSVWLKKRAPAALLVTSAVSFSIGFSLFAFTSDQSLATRVVTAIVTASTAAALITVSSWFATERWVYSRYQGKKLLADILDDWKDKTGLDTLGQFLKSKLGSIRARCLSLVLRTFSWFKTHTQGNEHSVIPILPISEPTTLPATLHTQSAPGPIVVDPTPAAAPIPHLWRVVRNVIDLQQQEAHLYQNQFQELGRIPLFMAKVAKFKSRGSHYSHQKEITLLKWTEDGTRLATYSLDQTSLVFRPLAPSTSGSAHSSVHIHCEMAHPSGLVTDMLWSKGLPYNYLLTTSVSAVKVWTEDGLCRTKIQRNAEVLALAWFPGEEAFLCFERENQRHWFSKIDLTGTVMSLHQIPVDLTGVTLRRMVITQDGSRVIALARSFVSNRLKSGGRRESQMIVYNISERKVEYRIPMLRYPDQIVLSQEDSEVLVGFKESRTPPQLWKLSTSAGRTTLTLAQIYKDTVPTEMPVYPQFGGKADSLVCGFSPKVGVFMWDRRSGTLLHKIVIPDISAFAWHAFSKYWSFAAGKEDGELEVWTAPNNIKFPWEAEEAGAVVVDVP